MWSFTALVVEPTKGTLYLYDGLEAAASTNYEAHEAKPFDNTCYIGGHVDHNDPNLNIYFYGTIDDVYFYNRSLSPAEVLGLAGLSGTYDLGLEPWRPDADANDTVNFSDYTVTADNWLKEVLWPSD